MINKIVLASSSPRRKEILEMLKIPFEIFPSDADENIETELSAEDYVMTLSKRKGEDVFSKLKKRGYDMEKTIVFFIGIVSFFAIMIEAILFQQKCVDTTKQMNPEKKASVYDMRFQKKGIDDCDEAEKIMIGKCAFKAYSATNVVCTVLAIVLAVCALVFDIGFLPSLMVCLVWIVNLSVYCKEAMRYSKAGNKIS